MNRPSIRIEILGEGVVPQTTRASDLADLIASIERALIATAEAQGREVTEEDYVSLVNVEEGSNRLTLALAAGLLTAAGVVSGAIATDAYEQLPGSALEALHDVSSQAAKRNWSVGFIEDERNRIRAATISVDHPVPPPSRPPSATGTTTIFGRCIRVGGATKPRAEIRLTTGDLLNIDVSEELAKSLARNLYEDVCIEGRGHLADRRLGH